MFNFFKKIFSKALKAVKKFFKIAMPQILQIVFAELKDFAIEAVENLEYSELNNVDKRKEVFDRIQRYAEDTKIDISSSAINLLIEMTVQYIKQRKK